MNLSSALTLVVALPPSGHQIYTFCQRTFFFNLTPPFPSFHVLVVQFPPSNVAFICFRPFDSKNPFLAPVTVNRRLNKGGNRHLMHLELDITGSKIRLVWFSRNYCICFMAQCHSLGFHVMSGMNRETTLLFSPQMTQHSWTSWGKSLERTLILLSLSTTLMVRHWLYERALSLLCVVTCVRVTSAHVLSLNCTLLSLSSRVCHARSSKSCVRCVINFLS